MTEQPIDLTAMEVLFLTDRVQNTDREDGHEIAKPLLLKLASCYIEMIGDKPKDGTVTLTLTEPEVWLARSKFNSGDRCDADSKLGVHILRKLYTALLAFNAEMDQWPDADSGDMTMAEAQQHLTQRLADTSSGGA
jgi:hypothetical protein